MTNDKGLLSRSMLLRHDVNVDLVLDGKSISIVIPAALFTIQDTGKLVDDNECIQMIYGSILNALSPDNSSWFTREKYAGIQEFFELKMNPVNGNRLHLRGFSYENWGTQFSIHYEYAAAILGRSALSDTFTFKFDLAKALSGNPALLATLSDRMISVNNRIWEDGLSRASFAIDERSASYRPKVTGIVDDEEDEITIESAFYVNKQGKRLPLDVNQDNEEDDLKSHESNPFDQNEYATPLGARPKPRMVNIPPTYDRNKSNHNRRPDYMQQHSDSTTQNGVRRYSCKLGNIPGTARNSNKNQAATLVFDVDETRDSRLAALITLGKDRIPEQRHRNVGSVTKEAQLDPICFLVWLESFVKRCFSKNIYCPSILSYLPNSYMGREWDSGGVPDEVLDKHVQFSAALKEDLLFVTSKQDKYHNIVSISRCGFSALHNIIRLACQILKDQVPNTTLLSYEDGSDITQHVKRVHEYILQCKLVGISLTEYQQWQNLIRGLPIKVRSMLETSAANEISQPGFDRLKNLPFNLRIENAAAFVLSECIDKGLLKDISATKKSQLVEHSQILKYFAKTKKCFYCGEDHLKNDCDKYMLVDKKTRQEKAPYVKQPYVKSPHPPKKNIHEVTVDEPKDTDEEIDIQYPSAEIGDHDEITSEEMEEVEKQFISVLNLDHEPFDESEYNCISVIKNGYENDESNIFDEEGFQQIMAYQDAIPYCRECASYDHLTANCPKTMVEGSAM